jgi:hypothetical protein
MKQFFEYLVYIYYVLFQIILIFGIAASPFFISNYFLIKELAWGIVITGPVAIAYTTWLIQRAHEKELKKKNLL